nr:hypothetical protein [uncultured Lichenicoccus sp.]
MTAGCVGRSSGRCFIAAVRDLGGDLFVTKRQGSIYGVSRSEPGREVIPVSLALGGDAVPVNSGNFLSCHALSSEPARKDVYDEFVRAVGPLSTTRLSGFPGFEIKLLDSPEIFDGFLRSARHLVELATSG